MGAEIICKERARDNEIVWLCYDGRRACIAEGENEKRGKTPVHVSVLCGHFIRKEEYYEEKNSYGSDFAGFDRNDNGSGSVCFAAQRFDKGRTKS